MGGAGCRCAASTRGRSPSGIRRHGGAACWWGGTVAGGRRHGPVYVEAKTGGEDLRRPGDHPAVVMMTINCRGGTSPTLPRRSNARFGVSETSAARGAGASKMRLGRRKTFPCIVVRRARKTSHREGRNGRAPEADLRGLRGIKSRRVWIGIAWDAQARRSPLGAMISGRIRSRPVPLAVHRSRRVGPPL